ncbi:MAG: hypothetical protein EB149_00540 [Thaumarchaeota archaeon]|nr:hypothetical protein [Nitrososphaerota archaeon]
MGVILVGIAVSIVFGLILTAPSENTGREQIYHARLADPKQYNDGVFSDTFLIKKGVYEFRFVPNGDSPQKLSIALKGPSFSFAENFVLEGTEHGEIGKYYTWKYLGQDKIEILEDQQLQITINPNGNVMGPVSVYLVK